MAQRLAIEEAESDEIQREIERLVKETNLQPFEAAAAVARQHGVVVSDLVPTRPLTDEERRRIGIGRSILEFMPRPEGGQE